MGDVITPFLGALQACVSVLLTLSYGVIIRQLGLIQKTSIHDVSGLGVKVLLPALILVHLGEQLNLDNAMNYIPVLVWAITYTCLSIGLARLASKLLRLPDWVTPTCAFNNTTSLPLLLLQSLQSVGSLKIIVRDGDSVSEAVARAQSYFLLCGVISKTIGYAVGPMMLTSQDDGGGGGAGEASDTGSEADVEANVGRVTEPESYPDENGHEPRPAESMPLLRGRHAKPRESFSAKMRRWRKKVVYVFPRRIKHDAPTPFDNPAADVAILCTIIGAVLGLVPPLHRAFFNDYEDGGIFNAWLTSSIKNTGKLFTTLQVIFVGCELGVSFERMGRGGSGGRASNPGVKAILTIFFIRLVLWPAISISLIYALAKKTGLLRSDPVLWFSLMLMPAGPPALVIQGLAELARATEVQKMTIAKTLTIMYMLSPCISFTITGALKASQAALES
ncbi:hypothetical protein BJX61DRAFT_378531 [Aspergillus egyptiacus]|nr:hypothetical protein BJX61DRAFT_378531 [Aspergillus egyptiacus]